MTRDSAQTTILFADIAGSTLLYESAGDAVAHRTVAACLQTLGDICARKSGRVVKTIGDEILCTFQSVDHALLAACEMQLAFREWGQIRLRIGFHPGAVVDASGDVFGDTVNLAARVVELANPGQILMTGEAYEELSPAMKTSCRRLYSTSVRGRVANVTLFEAMCTPDEELTVIVGGKSFEAPTGNRLALSTADKAWDMNEGSASMNIGRGVSDGVSINLPTASRHHASITVMKGKYILTDTSSNGTYVRMANGDEYILRREEFILNGAGRIGLGCPVDQCADKALAFELKK